MANRVVIDKPRECKKVILVKKRFFTMSKSETLFCCNFPSYSTVTLVDEVILNQCTSLRKRVFKGDRLSIKQI